MKVRVEHSGGDLTVRWIPPALAWAVGQLPALLSDDAEGLGDRIHRSPFLDDQDAEDEWGRHALPELRHLFEESRETVRRDLENLRRELIPIFSRLPIPGEHVTAWLSALAAARVGLGEAHDVDADDMAEPPRLESRKKKDRAVLLIQLLGWFQALLIGED